MMYYRTEDGKTELRVKGNLFETISEIGQLVHFVHVKMSKQNIFSGLEFERMMRRPEFWDEVFKARDSDQEIAEMNERWKEKNDD
ncbi:MAG: hypothetical protein IKE85_06065 [Mogibacterium sp.]|nr:hypothetical protein [Mogibacterium sp.]